MRRNIDRAIVDGLPYRNISGKYEVSLSALYRHSCEHLPEALRASTKAEEIADADRLIDRVEYLYDEARNVLEEAKKSSNSKTVLAAIREARPTIELLARLMGKIEESRITNILVNPQWYETRALILAALEPFPDARQAVVESLVDE